MELEFSSGLNVLTGETGAGKSFILKAINFLTGDKLSPDMVRGGAAQATDLSPRELDVLRAVAAGIIVPRVWRRYALADVGSAHADLEQGRSQGAIILAP